MGRDDTPGGNPPRRRRSARLGRTGARFPSPDPAWDASSDPGPAPAPSPHPAGDRGPGDGAADDRVGRTGARFPAPEPGREQAARAAADAVVHPQAPPVRLSEVRRAGSPDPEPDDSPTVALSREAVDEEISFTRVRPYVRTGGRTRTRTVLDVATLVSVPRPRPGIVHPEHLAIEEVCDGPRSVAEVAARMSVPLGVARVLIDDMAALGFLLVHQVASSGEAPSQDFMARVLEGLRRL